MRWGVLLVGRQGTCEDMGLTSGVTSLGVKPVPPVVISKSTTFWEHILRAMSWMRGFSSGTMKCCLHSNPGMDWRVDCMYGEDWSYDAFLDAVSLTAKGAILSL
jgi:hypothetical protein